jgi:chromosome partitioning protein
MSKGTTQLRRISILNFKGGAGKTTLATNLAHALAIKGQRVLLVDCDRQRNSSSLLEEQREPNLTQVLKGQASFTDAIQQARENLYVIPSGKDLNTANDYIVATGLRAYNTLKNATKNLQNFDFVIYDHSPSYSRITEVVLLASDEMLIPVPLEPYAFDGLLDMIETLGETLTALDHEVDIAGIVPFELDERYKMTGIYLKSLHKNFAGQVINSVRTDTDVKRAQSNQQTIFEYAPKNKGAAQDFRDIADLLLQRKGVTV